MIHHISAEYLTVDRVREILENNIKIDLSEDAKKRIVRCREYLDNKMETQKEPIYGITTGFGSLCNISIDKDQLSQLQKNLVMSHACGTGERVPAEIVKLMLLLKIQSLSYGNSGVQLETVQRLVDFFNNDVLPVVFQQGSLGASGDLAPLANMCLPLLGLGEVEYKGARRPSDEVLKEFGWKPISLQSKEGLALLNGTQFMSAFGVYSLIKARRLSEWADLIGAMSLDAFDGRINPFIDEVHEIRAHKGQLTTARNFRRLLEGSEMIARPKKHVQDPYSFRCIPQVHGASKDTIDYATKRNSNGTVRRYFNGNVILHVSREVIKNKLLSLEAMKVVTKHGKETWVSKGRTYMIDNEAHEIVSQFNTEIRGFYNYYSIANNASALGRSFGCIMKFSMYKTLAQKLNMSVRKVIETYRKDNLFVVPFVNKGGETKYRVFYNEGYARKTDCETAPSDNLPYMFKTPSLSLIERLTTKTCELCGKHGEVVMHHVRTLKELKGKNDWERKMLHMHRKTLVVCAECNAKIQSCDK